MADRELCTKIPESTLSHSGLPSSSTHAHEMSYISDYTHTHTNVHAYTHSYHIHMHIQREKGLIGGAGNISIKSLQTKKVKEKGKRSKVAPILSKPLKFRLHAFSIYSSVASYMAMNTHNVDG